MIDRNDIIEHQARAYAARLGLPHMDFLLRRTRVHRRLDPVRNGGVITLVAGPGYGKTAYIVDVLSTLEARRVYLALDKGDRSPLRFIGYLRAGIGLDIPVEPSPRSQSRPVPERLETMHVELARRVVEEVREQAGERTVLAIDDLHLVDASPEVTAVLALLVRGLPPGWTVILASRRPLPIQIDSLRLGGRLVDLGCRQLRLTPSEVEAWAIKNWKTHIGPADARAIWRLTQGWPAALVFLGQRVLSSGLSVTRRGVVDLVDQGHGFRTYLEQNITGSLDENAARVLLTAGLFPQVVFPRDEAIFGTSRAEAESALEECVARGFFVTRSGRRSYKVHPLVRGFAEKDARQHEQGIDLMKRIAAHLETQGEHDHAARLYMRGGRFGDASRSLRSVALSTLNAAVSLTREEIHGLVSGQCSQGETHEPWLLVAKAKSLQQRTDYGPAGTLYQTAARLLAAAGDRRGLLPVLLSYAFCLSVQGLWEESLSVLKRCWSVASTAEEKAEVLVAQGSVLVSLCRWDEGVESWERALALAPEDRRDALAQRVYLGRARLFHSLGHYRLGQSWAERIVERGTRSAAPTRVMALNGASILACQTGDYDRAERLMNECQRLARTKRYAFMEAPLLVSEANICVGRWDYRSAVAKCREAQSLAARTRDAEQAYWVEQILGDLSRRNRNAKRAVEHHEAALAIAEKSRLGVFERAQAQVAIGMDLVLQGLEAEARSCLEQTAQTSRQWGLQGSLVPSLFYLGWLHARIGREHEAACCLGEAMRVAAEHEHIHFFSQEARVAVPIFALCERYCAGSFLKDNIVPRLPVRFREYFVALAAGRRYPTDVALGPPQNAHLIEGIAGGVDILPDAGCPDSVSALISTLTDREREILKAIAGGMPNKVIGAKLFISEKTVKTHANHIFRKLGVTSRLQAALVFQSYQRALAAGTAGRNRSR